MPAAPPATPAPPAAPRYYKIRTAGGRTVRVAVVRKGSPRGGHGRGTGGTQRR